MLRTIEDPFFPSLADTEEGGCERASSFSPLVKQAEIDRARTAADLLSRAERQAAALIARAEQDAVKIRANGFREGVAEGISAALAPIAEVESNLVPSATNRNRNGSVDYGVMQVNSLHLPKLKAIGIDERRLLDEPCVSVHAGASILAEMIARYGYTWAAVGAYNAGGSAARGAARHQYATKVWRRYSAMVSARERAMPATGGGNEGAGRGRKKIKIKTIMLQSRPEESV